MATKKTYGLGRIPSPPDERDYPIDRLKAMIAAGEAKPVAWPNRNRVLDQGHQPFCVAFGILGLLNTDDEMHNDPCFTDADARDFFATIPNADPLNGACVRDGLKAAKAAGMVAAYAPLHSDDAVDDWLGYHGPVLMGTAWTKRMMKPVHDVVFVDGVNTCGGHCYIWHGQDDEYRLGTNSWGEGWGDHGRFRMGRIDDSMLRREGGEAWAVVAFAPKPKPLSLWKRLTRYFR